MWVLTHTPNKVTSHSDRYPTSGPVPTSCHEPSYIRKGRAATVRKASPHTPLVGVPPEHQYKHDTRTMCLGVQCFGEQCSCLEIVRWMLRKGGSLFQPTQCGPFNRLLKEFWVFGLGFGVIRLQSIKTGSCKSAIHRREPTNPQVTLSVIEGPRDRPSGGINFLLNSQLGYVIGVRGVLESL